MHTLLSETLQRHEQPQQQQQQQQQKQQQQQQQQQKQQQQQQKVQNVIDETARTLGLAQTLLLLVLVALDRLHHRSSLSLLLIHLRTQLDSLIDNPPAHSGRVFQLTEKNWQLVFEHASYFHIEDLAAIYNDLLEHPLELTFTSFKIRILASSESIQDYLHFNGVFDEESIIAYNESKIAGHIHRTAFSRESGLGDNPSRASSHDVCRIIQSENFTDFHLKRWKVLRLLDRHIFKPATTE